MQLVQIFTCLPPMVFICKLTCWRLTVFILEWLREADFLLPRPQFSHRLDIKVI